MPDGGNIATATDYPRNRYALATVSAKQHLTSADVSLDARRNCLMETPYVNVLDNALQHFTSADVLLCAQRGFLMEIPYTDAATTSNARRG